MKIQLIAAILLTVLSLAGCSERNIKKQLAELTSTAVIIPSEINQVLMGRDTLLFNVGANIPRLIIYTDSLSCSSCRLKYMYEFNDILDLYETTGKAFTPIFIYSPPQGQENMIRTTLQLYRFDYPILLDDKGLFASANPHIPTDNRFHTFLIDKNGKVVLVGNPANNPALWELYKTTITELIDNGGTMPPETETLQK